RAAFIDSTPDSASAPCVHSLRPTRCGRTRLRTQTSRRLSDLIQTAQPRQFGYRVISIARFRGSPQAGHEIVQVSRIDRRRDLAAQNLEAGLLHLREVFARPKPRAAFREQAFEQ